MTPAAPEERARLFRHLRDAPQAERHEHEHAHARAGEQAQRLVDTSVLESHAEGEHDRAHPERGLGTPDSARTNTIGDTPRQRAARSVCTGSTSVVEIAYATATPTTPQCRPTANAVRWRW